MFFLDNHGQTLMLDVKSPDIVGNQGQSLHVIFGYTENNWVQGIQFQVARIESKKLDMILRYSTILAGVICFVIHLVAHRRVFVGAWSVPGTSSTIFLRLVGLEGASFLVPSVLVPYGILPMVI